MNKKRSVLLVLAMVFVLCFALSAGAFASGFGGGDGSSNDPYQISTEQHLRDLANDVNSGTEYANTYFKLMNDIPLTSGWTPIGKSTSTSGVPTGESYFSGIFDGQGNTISGLSITSATTAGVGLFGYVNGGIIGNLTVAGSISGLSSNINAIGGVVGYTNSSVLNCTSEVEITASNDSNVGGVIGIVENTMTSGSAVLVQYCKNTGSVTASKRLGGVIGAAYAPNASGMVYVDKCENTGDVTGESDAYKSFFGGVIGYCEAYISNCIHSGVVEASSGATGHRMGGVVGILSGYGAAKARMANCLNLGSFINVSGTSSYDGALCVPESGTTMDNSFWDVNIPTATQSTSYSATNVAALSTAQLQRTATYNNQYIDDYINDVTPWGVFADAFTCSPGSYPVLKFPANPVPNLSSYPKGTSRTGNDDAYTNAVYYNSAAFGDEDGSFEHPYSDFGYAVTHLGGSNYLCVQSPISVSDYTSYGSGLSGKTIARSYIYDGSLFEVSSGTLTLNDITLDGNATTTVNSSLINVTGGSVIIGSTGSSVTLQNNKTRNKGAAIRTIGGPVTINGGTITGNTSDLGANGGNGIAVLTGPSSNGSLTISPTSTIFFGTNDNIYLDSGRTIAIGNATNFASDVTAGNIKVTCSVTDPNTIVATGVTQDLRTYFSYFGAVRTFDYSPITQRITLH